MLTSLLYVCFSATQCSFQDQMILLADSEGPGQTAQMRKGRMAA